MEKKMKIYKLYKDGCGPCLMLEKELEKVLVNFPNVNVEHINVKDRMDLVEKHKIQTVPFLLVEKDDKIVARSVGFREASSIERLLRSVE